MISFRALTRILAPTLLAAASLAGAPAALADTVTAPITRGGVVVGSATAYFGTANGYGVLDPKITNFTPPVNGVRYTAYVQLKASCNGMAGTWNSVSRGANFSGTTTFRLNGLVKECSSTGTTVELWAFVKRASTGAIVGRARLFSAG